MSETLDIAEPEHTDKDLDLEKAITEDKNSIDVATSQADQAGRKTNWRVSRQENVKTKTGR